MDGSICDLIELLTSNGQEHGAKTIREFPEVFHMIDEIMKLNVGDVADDGMHAPIKRIK